MSRELERTRSLSRMIAGFVHQFRSPLHIITSAGDTLAESSKIPEALKPEIDLMRRSAARLNTAVNHLLAFAKGEPLPWTENSINEPLNKVVDFLKEECLKRKVKLELKEETKLPLIRMQSSLLEEAILNFAMNGLEAMPQGGVLSLTSYVEGKKSCLRIQDTGQGMDARTLKKIGQAFSSGKKSGVGLGVYFACEILKTHKADVQFTSQPDQGTVVSIVFSIPTV